MSTPLQVGLLRLDGCFGRSFYSVLFLTLGFMRRPGQCEVLGFLPRIGQCPMDTLEHCFGGIFQTQPLPHSEPFFLNRDGLLWGSATSTPSAEAVLYSNPLGRTHCVPGSSYANNVIMWLWDQVSLTVARKEINHCLAFQRARPAVSSARPSLAGLPAKAGWGYRAGAAVGGYHGPRVRVSLRSVHQVSGWVPLTQGSSFAGLVWFLHV